MPRESCARGMRLEPGRPIYPEHRRYKGATTATARFATLGVRQRELRRELGCGHWTADRRLSDGCLVFAPAAGPQQVLEPPARPPHPIRRSRILRTRTAPQCVEGGLLSV